jgi:1-acyl-sn-glycerol-3-phosphate acyltransferase
MAAMVEQLAFRYPRRRWGRALIRRLTYAIFAAISDFRVDGRENLPKEGPLLVVSNHFSFLDPVAVIAISPWPIEFVGGFRTPNAPPLASWLREMWGFYPVYRGTGSQIAFRAAQAVFDQRGVMGIFPEGSSAHALLRAPRPGAAFMAARSRPRILPVGLDGLVDVFPSLRRGRRARVTVSIGRPFGPFDAPGRGRGRRERLEEIGHEMMQRIAELLPADRRGLYSEDPAVRKAAEQIERYQWDEEPEG